MIDYEKLKRAHELASILSVIDKYPVYISARLFHEFSMYRLQSRDIEDNEESHFEKIDDLITKLEELTKPEPKFKVGQKVWWFARGCDEQLVESLVTEVLNSDDGFSYLSRDMDDGGMGGHSESKLYPTREALIQSQIAHWQELLEPKASCCSIHAGGDEECKKECEHEPSASKWVSPADMIEKFKCKKCGEFYK